MVKGKADPRDLIANFIKINGIKQSFIADKILKISDPHFSLVLKKERELSENNRMLFNTHYGTSF
jgi:hypothetical protein